VRGRPRTERLAADVDRAAAGPSGIMDAEGIMARRNYATGQLYEKHGSYYGRWRTSDGRKLNRKLGAVRRPGESAGLTRTQAERRLRQIQDEEERRPRRPITDSHLTIVDAADSLRRQLAIEGARTSYRQNCESMQRVHVAPRLGGASIDRVTASDLEDLAASMLAAGRAPKTVRNVLTFLHAVFEHAIDRGWVRENPVRRATRPKRRRSNDANPDLQFLTLDRSRPCCARSPTRWSAASRPRRVAAGQGPRRLRRRTCSVRCCA